MLAGWLGRAPYYGLLAIGLYLAYRDTRDHERHGCARADRITRLLAFGGIILVIGFGIAAGGDPPAVGRGVQHALADGYEGATTNLVALTERLTALLSQD
jgi:hypothetical protein